MDPNIDIDDIRNLWCLCPTHHRLFDKGHFWLVPVEGETSTFRVFLPSACAELEKYNGITIKFDEPACSSLPAQSAVPQGL
jgi:hypothetical protein